MARAKPGSLLKECMEKRTPTKIDFGSSFLLDQARFTFCTLRWFRFVDFDVTAVISALHQLLFGKDSQSSASTCQWRG